ncbi:MAG: HesA/MoeB/ThiF family protein [Arenicella sp.]|nr:HesA/MoeB/ThiF family protein [Arenicella sp.]
MNESDRYSRQSRLQQIGSAGQQKLKDSSVLIVGAGGLGCQVAAQLAGAGVGHITVVDHDSVALSNIHRQVLFREQDVGLPKATVVARELAAINSTVEVSAVRQKLSPANVAQLLRDVSAVVDAGDNFALSYLLSDACKDKLPLVSASVNQTFGYVGVFCGELGNQAPSYRAAFPQIPLQQQSCDLVGVTGPGVGVIASLQAQETLKVLLGDAAQLRGKLLYLDVWSYAQHIVDLSGAVETENQISLIDVGHLRASDAVLDVRDQPEIDSEPQPFRTSLQIPLAELEQEEHLLPQSGRIVCCCQSGQRALLAAQKLSARGFTDLAVVLSAA